LPVPESAAGTSAAEAIPLENLSDAPSQPRTKPTKPGGVAVEGRVVARRPLLKVPAILLEGDEPELPAVSGPGEKFALGPETPAAHFNPEAAHLPATYGTGRLFLTARDPHWLYAHWDINTTVQFRHNARSVDRHLILRMQERAPSGKPAFEIHVHPESRHWFAHVEHAGAEYVADLGYYQAGRKWRSLATSAPRRTPPDTVSTDSTVEFATIPLDLPFETMLALLKEGEAQRLPLARAVEQRRARRLREFAGPEWTASWTPAQERALAEIVAARQTQGAARGSEEFAGPPAGGELAAGLEALDLFSFIGGETVSSPLGGGESVRSDFWLNVNAELIIYGATQPDASVTVAGRRIPLRPDGTFGFRFALPDGQYELPIVAVSADHTDGRAAELKFSRATELFGHVGAHPQDPALKPPPETIT
jgi:hypothetical protein